MATTGIRLAFSDGRPSVSSLADVNRGLAEVASRLWPIDLTQVPGHIKSLLAKPAVTEAEAERLKAQFLLPRERLCEIIERAGRQANVSGGGALTTLDATHGYYYPQLWTVQSAIDYSRFDRFHVNAADDGTGVDEVLQMLTGRGVVVRHRLPNQDTLLLRLDCPNADSGWLLTYDGGKPHIGSLSQAAPGSKLLVQIIGPTEWRMRYSDGP